MDEIAVSVICVVYNHEKYLKQCLDGFVMQKTDFAFEVLVHDDASTDNSASIIREYAEKYPNIFKPIFQTENQYSQGVRITKDIIYPKTKGKYIAFCEGDDFWIDPLKLQKQFDVMEKHPECCLCVSKVKVCNENGKPTEKYYPSKAFLLEDGILNRHEYQKLLFCEHEMLFQTSCFFIRKAILSAAYELKYSASMNGDISYLYAAVYFGELYYIDEILSTNRAMPIGGWSERMSLDRERFVSYIIEEFKGMRIFDGETRYLFHSLIYYGVCKRSGLASLNKNELIRFMETWDLNFWQILKAQPSIRKKIRLIGMYFLPKSFDYRMKYLAKKNNAK